MQAGILIIAFELKPAGTSTGYMCLDEQISFKAGIE
jgi:hypothetical protein